MALRSLMMIYAPGEHPLYTWLTCFCPQAKSCADFRSYPSRSENWVGIYLNQLTREHGELSFVVWEQSGLRPRIIDQKLSTPRVIEIMIREKNFDMARFVFEVQNKVIPIHISLCFGDLATFPISGYPRLLFTDMANDNTARNHIQTKLSSFPTGLDTFARAASRYTHGSRRLKKVATWEPPALLERASLTDLWSYGDPNRVIGSDVINHGHDNAEKSNESSLPEAIVPQKQDAAHQDLAPQQPATPQSAPQQPASEQRSTRTTLWNAFRGLLWPIRARPLWYDPAVLATPEGHGVPQSYRDGQEWKTSLLYPDQGCYESDVPPASPPRMQYYHVGSAENEIYQQWVSLLGPTMGHCVPLSGPEPGLYRQPQAPFTAQLDSETAPVELLGDFALAVELP